MKEDTSDSEQTDFGRQMQLPRLLNSEGVQPDMVRMDEMMLVATTPVPGRRLSDLSQGRKEQLREVLKRFGLEPTETIWTRLNRAFIHRSYRSEANLDEDNERLEFLGDSVIGLLCTEYILRLFPESDEGILSKLRATIVSRAILGRIASSMKLGDVLLLSGGEDRSGGRERVNLLGSTLEAVCGVLYLHYPWHQIREPIYRTVIIPGLELARQNFIADYKSALQEWAQRKYKKVPEYRTVEEEGPDHQKIFQVEAWVGDNFFGRGTGPRKKTAENEAARQSLIKLGLISADS